MNNRELLNMISFRKSILLFLIALAPLVHFGQGRKEALQKSKSQIEEEIQYTNKLLRETQKNKQTSLNQVMLLKNQIDRRENLITTINDQVSNIDEEIIKNAKSLEEMTLQLQKLKNEYSMMVYYAWTHRKSNNTLVFILSAENFNQAYRRMNYIQLYTSYRKRQVKMIKEKQRLIFGIVEELKVNKTEKISLINSQQTERDNLSKEQEEKNIKLSELKKRESELRKTLKEKEQVNRQLQSSIQNLISEEIRKASENKNTVKEPITKVEKKKKVEKNKNNSKINPTDENPETEKKAAPTVIAMTPEETALSNSFADNKGRLPWPIEKGVISSSFGEHPHPVLSGVIVKNNGIDMLTQAGMRVRSIFNGVVSGVVNLPNGAKAIIIRHGDYLSVYSNLESVTVRTNQKVTTKQDIGSIRTDSQESKTELHFELWHNKTLQNPAFWIAR
ncbi:MAG: peptidoglycan DD-metalloendopeptidase family protein [Bacteroidota bacterium]